MIVSNEPFRQTIRLFIGFWLQLQSLLKFYYNNFFRQESSIFSVSESMETVVELVETRAVVDRRERLESGDIVVEGVESGAAWENVESDERRESVESEESETSWSGLASPHCPCWVVNMA